MSSSLSLLWPGPSILERLPVLLFKTQSPHNYVCLFSHLNILFNFCPFIKLIGSTFKQRIHDYKDVSIAAHASRKVEYNAMPSLTLTPNDSAVNKRPASFTHLLWFLILIPCFIKKETRNYNIFYSTFPS